MSRETEPGPSKLDKLLPNAEEIKTLPPERRKDYARFVIEEFLARHPSGATPNQIARATGLSSKTVYHHLEVLTAMRRAIRREWGRRQRVYFPITEEPGPRPDYTMRLGQSHYAFRKADQDGRLFIQIQERETSTDGMMRTKGGILIPADEVDAFARHLSQFADELIK